jgi:hypothetical protein
MRTHPQRAGRDGPRINCRQSSLLDDARGVPLSLVASGANVQDVKLLGASAENIACLRPKPNDSPTETLCMDAGYVGYAALGGREGALTVQPIP